MAVADRPRRGLGRVQPVVVQIVRIDRLVVVVENLDAAGDGGTGLKAEKLMSVQEVTAANGSTVYRTTFTGMSRDRAVAFCNALKAAGRDCIVR